MTAQSLSTQTLPTSSGEPSSFRISLRYLRRNPS